MPIKKSVVVNEETGDEERLPDEFATKCVTIRKDQDAFIKAERLNGKKFKLSSFIQYKLDGYIKFRKEGERFLENDKKRK